MNEFTTIKIDQETKEILNRFKDSLKLKGLDATAKTIIAIASEYLTIESVTMVEPKAATKKGAKK